MANIKLNLNEFNTYLQNNKIDFSAEQAKFDTIFKECNTITPDDGELKDGEMKKKMLSELEDENSLNQFIEDWLVKCGYGDYPESPAL